MSRKEFFEQFGVDDEIIGEWQTGNDGYDYLIYDNPNGDFEFDVRKHKQTVDEIFLLILKGALIGVLIQQVITLISKF